VEYQETSKFTIQETLRFTFKFSLFIHLFQFKNVETERTCELKMKQAHLSADNIVLGEGLSDKMWLFFLKFDTQMWCLNSNEEVKSANYYYVYITVLYC